MRSPFRSSPARSGSPGSRRLASPGSGQAARARPPREAAAEPPKGHDRRAQPAKPRPRLSPPAAAKKPDRGERLRQRLEAAVSETEKLRKELREKTSERARLAEEVRAREKQEEHAAKDRERVDHALRQKERKVERELAQLDRVEARLLERVRVAEGDLRRAGGDPDALGADAEAAKMQQMLEDEHARTELLRGEVEALEARACEKPRAPEPTLVRSASYTRPLTAGSYETPYNGMLGALPNGIVGAPLGVLGVPPVPSSAPTNFGAPPMYGYAAPGYPLLSARPSTTSLFGYREAVGVARPVVLM